MVFLHSLNREKKTVFQYILIERLQLYIKLQIFAEEKEKLKLSSEIKGFWHSVIGRRK